MDLNTIAAIVAAAGAIAAAIAAIITFFPARKAAGAAADQTQIQRDLMQQAAQPYVWADIQPDMQQGHMAQLVLGNSGPTVATNVRVLIEPEISPDPQHPLATQASQKALASGIHSLAPGRVIRWSLGPMATLIERADNLVFHFIVSANGPYGPLEPLEIDISPSDWAKARDAPDGSLHHLRQEIQKLNESIGGVVSQLKRVVK